MKCLDRGLHSSLGAELEAIRNRLRAIDAQRSPFHRMGFDLELEGGFGEMDNANRRIVQFWGSGASLDGKPDFERVFGSQFVESKGGGEAQNSKWDPLRDFKEGLVGGDRGFFCAVQTATHMFDLPGSSEVPEVRTGYGEAFELFRAHESPFLDEGPDMFHFLHQMAILAKSLHL